jgi:hypothetical protein
MTKSGADILERERNAMMAEWLMRVNLLPALRPLSDEERVEHLYMLYNDIVTRLRQHSAKALVSRDAVAHGYTRQSQGYTPPMLVDESRLFEVVTFQTLERHQDELDHKHVLSDIVLIADETDSQLGQAITAMVELQQDVG